MHKIVSDELERHLAGQTAPALLAHLEDCEPCRVEVAEMISVNAMIRQLGEGRGEAPIPLPGFYAKVAAGIHQQQNARVWGLLSPGVSFFRRVAFASLLLLAGLIGEALSDAQLRRFRSDPANRQRVCEAGLWKWSRHPNYFFEKIGGDWTAKTFAVPEPNSALIAGSVLGCVALLRRVIKSRR